MAKPPPGSEPDPMGRVVDRLLAQLPGLQGIPVIAAPESSTRFPVVTGGSAPRRVQAPNQSQALGVWLRVLLGLSLGVMMAGWPYLSTCGWPLAGYLSAVSTVTLAGGWAAVSAWKYRTALAHIISLILVFYGILLAAAEILPRVGYAAGRATWQCEEPRP